MEDKKAKFIVYIVVCLIAFICSSTVYSMTGGLSDWIAPDGNVNEDQNNNGILDSSEGQYYSESNSYDDSNGGSGFLDGIFQSSDTDSNSYSSSDEEPDFLARLIREFIGGNSATSSSSSDSSYYYEDTSSGYYYEDTGSNGLDELFTKADNKINRMFN